MQATTRYSKLAEIYDLVYADKNYESEVETLRALITQHQESSGRALLDVACGTGRHLDFLVTYFEAEGLDLSPEQIAVARSRLPAIPFTVGDMEDFDLPARFDVVTCLFSSIGYVQTEERLFCAIANMARHLKPGGVLVVEPWLLPGVYEPGRISTQTFEVPGRGVARVCVADIRDEGASRIAVMDMHYLMATPEGVEAFSDLHELGLFSQDAYLEAFRAAGLEVHHEPEGLTGRGLYIGVAPLATAAEDGSTEKPSVAFTVEDLEDALLFLNMSRPFGKALLRLDTGEVLREAVDTDLREITEAEEDGELDMGQCVWMPDQRELDLGGAVVFRFVEAHLPDDLDKVERMFSRRGAYGRYKDFLHRRNMLDAWYEFENAATMTAIRQWCRSEGIALRDAG